MLYAYIHYTNSLIIKTLKRKFKNDKLLLSFDCLSMTPATHWTRLEVLVNDIVWILNYRQVLFINIIHHINNACISLCGWPLIKFRVGWIWLFYGRTLTRFIWTCGKRFCSFRSYKTIRPFPPSNWLLAAVSGRAWKLNESFLLPSIAVVVVTGYTDPK